VRRIIPHHARDVEYADAGLRADAAFANPAEYEALEEQ
jgi:hypothetical protein